MFILKNFNLILTSFLIAATCVNTVTSSVCLWEYVSNLLWGEQHPSKSYHSFDTSKYLVVDAKKQFEEYFSPDVKDFKSADDGIGSRQKPNNAKQVEPLLEEPAFSDDSKSAVKQESNIAFITNSNGQNTNYSLTVVLICFLSFLVSAIVIYLVFAYREKNPIRNLLTAGSTHTIQPSSTSSTDISSTAISSTDESEDSENKVDEVLIDELSNRISSVMVRTYLESLVRVLEGTGHIEDVQKYLSDEFITMVSERIARDPNMRMEFMVQMTEKSLLRLAHLFKELDQQGNTAAFVGVPQVPVINVVVNRNQDGNGTTRTQKQTDVLEKASNIFSIGTQTDSRMDSSKEEGSATSLTRIKTESQTDVRKDSSKEGSVTSLTRIETESQTDVRKDSSNERSVSSLTRIKTEPQSDSGKDSSKEEGPLTSQTRIKTEPQSDELLLPVSKKCSPPQ